MTYSDLEVQLLDEANILECKNQELEDTLEMLRKKCAEVNRLEKKIKAIKSEQQTSLKNRILTESKKTCKRIKSKLKRIWNENKEKQVPDSFSGVSVILPTYKPNNTIEKAVDSVLKQKDISFNMEVIICVNGPRKEYYEELVAKYENCKRVRVLYTETVGASAGRNLGIQMAQFSHITFLDDDDYLTDRFLAAMVKLLDDKTDIVFGLFWDSELKENNYINKAIRSFNSNKEKRAKPQYSALFGLITGNLYSNQFLSRCEDFHEDFSNTEDIIFWTDNYENITGNVRCCLNDCNEYYVRVKTTDSLSRPTEENSFNFWVKDRLKVIAYIEAKMFKEASALALKKFYLSQIIAQNNHIYKYYQSVNDELKAEIRKCVDAYDGFYVKKGLYSNRKGIAFCYNFPPQADTSAYVAVKRLEQINKLEGDNFYWTSISKDYSDIDKNDLNFKAFYADFLCFENKVVGGKISYKPKSQYDFAKLAALLGEQFDADIIYSRSMAPASHLAAYIYKSKHPQVKWYAEFSDPVYLDADLNVRQEPYMGLYEDGDEFLNNIFQEIEWIAYRNADKLIFTNDIQREFMLEYNERKELNADINKKSIVWSHPIIEKKFANLLDSSYKVDSSKINIGFFGRFYKNRKADDLLQLLENKDVVIHLFTINSFGIEEIKSDRVKINDAVPYLHFLNLAAKMDYVFLNDMPSPMGVIPWLPSKLSDYLASGSRIIAQYIEGSPLSKIENENLIKVQKIDSEFANSLTKNKKYN